METKKKTASEKLDIEAKMYASEIIFGHEYPKVTMEIETYISNRVEKAYFDGYRKASSVFFEKMVSLISELQKQ